MRGLVRVVVFDLGWWLRESVWPLVPCIPRSCCRAVWVRAPFATKGAGVRTRMRRILEGLVRMDVCFLSELGFLGFGVGCLGFCAGGVVLAPPVRPCPLTPPLSPGGERGWSVVRGGFSWRFGGVGELGLEGWVFVGRGVWCWWSL